MPIWLHKQLFKATFGIVQFTGKRLGLSQEKTDTLAVFTELLLNEANGVWETHSPEYIQDLYEKNDEVYRVTTGWIEKLGPRA